MSELFGFIQTPEIVDIEKYILQKPGMRDSSESNNGLHGSSTNEEEGISTVQFKRISYKDSGLRGIENIYMCPCLSDFCWNENWEIQPEKKFNLFCKLLAMLLPELWHVECDKIE